MSDGDIFPSLDNNTFHCELDFAQITNWGIFFAGELCLLLAQSGRKIRTYASLNKITFKTSVLYGASLCYINWRPMIDQTAALYHVNCELLPCRLPCHEGVENNFRYRRKIDRSVGGWIAWKVSIPTLFPSWTLSPPIFGIGTCTIRRINFPAVGLDCVKRGLLYFKNHRLLSSRNVDNPTKRIEFELTRLLISIRPSPRQIRTTGWPRTLTVRIPSTGAYGSWVANN